MNEELQKQLLESLEKVTQWVEHAEAFTREQAPLVVQELLDYGYWHSLISTLLLLPIVLLIIAFGIHCYSKYVGSHDDDWLAACILSFIAATFIGWFTWWPVSVLIQISIAPRVYVLEQLMSF